MQIISKSIQGDFPMKRRILIVVVILSLVFAVAPASASAAPCDYWATRFWLAMAANNPGEANFAYGMWLGCTIRTIGGYPA
jgi:hypothetical protein